MCSFNNNIPVNIPSHPYALLNWSILCNGDVEAESNFLLESLAACDTSTPDLVRYFTVNLAFVNYCDTLIDSLDAPILQNWMTREQIYPFVYSLLSLIQVYYRCQNVKGFLSIQA